MDNFFDQTAEQKSILETVRRFVEDEVTPRSAAQDALQDPEDCFSWEIIEKADALGIRTLTLDEKWGGLGMDALTASMVIEELTKGDLGIGITLGQTMKLSQMYQDVLNEEQSERVLPAFAKDPRGVLSIAFTEPDNGSDWVLGYPTEFRTNAVKTDGGWIVNGMKHFISNANRSSHYVFFAQTEKGKPLTEGSTCFLLERDRPGFSIGRVHDKMGERLANNAEMIFQDCFLPDENVVGDVGGGHKVLGGSKARRFSNPYAATMVLGVSVALYDKAVAWAKVRIQGGKPLIEHSSVREKLAEMRMLIDVSRTYIHRAIWQGMHQDTDWDNTLSTFPKVMASQSAWKIATWCLEIHGGHGYMKEAGVEKLVRDAAAYLHSDGVNRTLYLKAANFLFKD
ncbi:acyl-CoA dehydrogenase family protein [Pseudomonadota bacterium]